ncbi:hypothetical protein BACUNI_02588 [Bacteroides uniformis ATCC 8492]|uniref:Uncharacterized protein n=1 Tax=Bacteroides uniformis (strain ATCC 8492 / DSM 6597 / CCUG 4942 / CIP 103695 / JCM 5828 / KCTC 5204 / NCTC 13054 / VPI 0061) TaxID=411479 RepID=A0ABC9NAZ4_BACUC|nr:hypothetical protein BACUNI_02588 [Bacteroides uniformis ATCC 8492]
MICSTKGASFMTFGFRGRPGFSFGLFSCAIPFLFGVNKLL